MALPPPFFFSWVRVCLEFRPFPEWKNLSHSRHNICLQSSQKTTLFSSAHSLQRSVVSKNGASSTTSFSAASLKYCFKDMTGPLSCKEIVPMLHRRARGTNFLSGMSTLNELIFLPGKSGEERELWTEDSSISASRGWSLVRSGREPNCFLADRGKPGFSERREGSSSKVSELFDTSKRAEARRLPRGIF
eukprot:Lithocolla_globosa_v1_NODE_137_length_5828_cov_7.342228.p2 type:complete len:190 gc:universal NODE_137_length_5828_cov_7.342228:1902-1333(-)